MAIDERLADILRKSLNAVPGIEEKRMFGGIAFLLNRHMVCGVHKGGAMFRVGKENEAKAKTIHGAKDMEFTGRRMGGMIDVDDAALLDAERRIVWLTMALDYVKSLPPKR